MSLTLALAASLLVQQPSPSPNQSPDTSVKVTYETFAVPVQRALSELGAKSGVKLEIAPAMVGPVVVLRVTDKPLREVMDRIATVTSGQWQLEEGQTYRLIRNPGLQSREASDERALLAADTRRAIQEYVKRYQPKPAAQPKPGAGEASVDGQQFGGMFGLGGAGVGKAISRIVAGLNPNQLVLAEDDARVVFATTTTRMQIPMTGNLGPVFAELVAEHNKVEEAKANRPKEEGNEEEEAMRAWLKLFGLSDEAKPVQERPAKAILVASKGGGFMGFGGGMVTLELRLYGSNGKVLLSGSEMLPVDSGSMGEMAVMAEQIRDRQGGTPKPKPAPAADDKLIEFRAESKQVGNYFGRFRGEGGWQDMPKEVLELLSRPDLYDPLSFAISDSLIAIGKHKNLQVVANLPDDFVSFFRIVSGEQAQTVNSALKQLESGAQTKSEMVDGWLIVRPAKPNDARRRRTDRASLAALIGAAKEKGAPSLDDLAAYAQRNDSPMKAPAAMAYIATFAPNALGGMQGMTDWNMVRFYGSLGAVEKRNLAAGGSIAFGQLSAYQRGLVERMVFGSNAKLRVRDSSKPAEEELGGFFEIMTSFMPGQTKDWREEPTELMPTGLPPSGLVTLALGEFAVGSVVGPSAAEMGPFGIMGPDELAMLRFLMEDPNMGPMIANEMPKIEGLKLGTRKEYRFSFKLAPDVSVDHRLQDDSIPKDGKVVAMDNLPADMKAEVERKLALYKKRPLPFFGGMGGRQTIPPR